MCWGFTLLEILVVLIVIALTAALAAPNLFSGPREKLVAEGDRLLLALNAARDEAALGGRVIGVAVSAQDVAFFERDLVDPNRWEQSVRDTLKLHRLPGEMQARSELASASSRIVFLPAGVAEPFAVVLSSEAGTLRLEADALGNLKRAGP